MLFSEYFNINEEDLEKYGAFNISIICDVPLFIDPFLLFNNSKKEYQDLHEEIIDYLQFLRKKSLATENLNKGNLKAWYFFSEVENNWLGFSVNGNKGSGLGYKFAKSLHENLYSIFNDFGSEEVTKGSHLEKLCLVSKGVGRDNISDFTTNLIKRYLLEYTQKFTLENIAKGKRKKFNVERVYFNYDTESWVNAEYELPNLNDNFVLLTPKKILTKDDTWINKGDVVKDFDNILNSVDNEELRAKINNYFIKTLPKNYTKKKYNEVIVDFIRKNSEFIDYYIKYKEDNGDNASIESEEKVKQVKNLLSEIFNFKNTLNEKGFYDINNLNVYQESLDRAIFLKNIIENNDGYRIFYRNKRIIASEETLQILYRIIWFNSDLDVNREVNNGRGPADFKISFGSKRINLVEIKLASNTHLEKNLINQVDIYKKANNTDNAIIIIIFFNKSQENKVKRILKSLKLDNSENVIVIDARNDNKVSASKV